MVSAVYTYVYVWMSSIQTKVAHLIVRVDVCVCVGVPMGAHLKVAKKDERRRDCPYHILQCWNASQKFYNFTILQFLFVCYCNDDYFCCCVLVYYFLLAFAFVPNDFDVCNFIDLLCKRDRPNAIPATAWRCVYMYIYTNICTYMWISVSVFVSLLWVNMINFHINVNW